MLVHAVVARDWPHSPLRLLAAFLLCLVVYGGAAAALAQSFAAMPGAALPRAGRVGLLLLPLLVLVTLGTTAGGPVVGLALLASAGLAVLVAGRRRRRAAEVPQQREPSAVRDRARR